MWLQSRQIIAFIVMALLLVGSSSNAACSPSDCAANPQCAHQCCGCCGSCCSSMNTSGIPRKCCADHGKKACPIVAAAKASTQVGTQPILNFTLPAPERLPFEIAEIPVHPISVGPSITPCSATLLQLACSLTI